MAKHDNPERSEFRKIPFGPQRCRHVGNFVLDTLEETLTEAAASGNGSLSVGEIKNAFEKFRRTPNGVWGFYKASFESCFSASQSAAPLGYERKNLFMRLITRTFADRLPENHPQVDDAPLLSRSIIVPFEATLEKILGAEFLETRQALCAEILDGLQRESGENFMWRQYYTDDRSLKILLETAAALSHHFKDFETRKKWFVDALNIQGDRDSQLAKNHDGVMEFTGKDFDILFYCLFHECKWILDEVGTATTLHHWLDDDDIASIRLLAEVVAVREP